MNLSPSIFARQVPASPFARTFAAALATPWRGTPPVQATFLHPAQAPIPTVSSRLLTYSPPLMNTTTPPIASQTSQAGSTSGLFARLATFSQGRAAPAFSLPTSMDAGINFNAPPVGTSPASFLRMQGSPSPVAPYNPSPPDLGVATVGRTPFLGPPAPGPQAPVGPAASLPMGPGDNYPGSGDGAYLTPAAPDPLAGTGLQGINWPRVAVYGGVAVGGLYLLSRMLKS